MTSRAIDIAYVHIAVEDLDRLSGFLARFGMTSTRETAADGRDVLYSCGTDGVPYQHLAEPGENRFVGVAFEVEGMVPAEKHVPYTSNDLNLMIREPT